jgi:hypothetical protein
VQPKRGLTDDIAVKTADGIPVPMPMLDAVPVPVPVPVVAPAHASNGTDCKCGRDKRQACDSLASFMKPGIAASDHTRVASQREELEQNELTTCKLNIARSLIKIE